MNLAVTGAASFVGEALHSYCQAHRIGWTGVDLGPAGPRHAIAADITGTGWWDAWPGGADALVHLAAISRDADCRQDPARAIAVNLTGVQRVIEAAAARRIPQIIFASSEWVYGDAGPALIDETSPIDAAALSGEYAVTKLAGERWLAMAHERSGVAVTVLRFGIIYGPRPANWSAVEALDNAVRTRDVVQVGSLATARRFVHVADIAAGIAASVGRTGFEIFNLTGDRPITLGEVIAESARVHGRRPVVGEREPGRASVRNACNAKAGRLLGWRPRIELPEGLQSLGTLEPAAVTA